jgi:hypothetical protein
MDQDQLIGAAQRWGIENPEGLSLEDLRHQVAARRINETQANTESRERGLLGEMKEWVNVGTGMGAAALRTSAELAEMLRMTMERGSEAGGVAGGPMALWQIVSKVAKQLDRKPEAEGLREISALTQAKQYFSSVQEGARRNMHPEMHDRFDAMTSAAGFVGMFPLASAAWKAVGLGARGFLGATPFWNATSVLAKAGRAGLQGGLTTSLFEMGTDKPAIPHSGDLNAIGQDPTDADAWARVLFGNQLGASLFGAALSASLVGIHARLQNSRATAAPGKEARAARAGDDIQDADFEILAQDQLAAPPLGQRRLPPPPPPEAAPSASPLRSQGTSVIPVAESPVVGNVADLPPTVTPASPRVGYHFGTYTGGPSTPGVSVTADAGTLGRGLYFSRGAPQPGLSPSLAVQRPGEMRKFFIAPDAKIIDFDEPIQNIVGRLVPQLGSQEAASLLADVQSGNIRTVGDLYAADDPSQVGLQDSVNELLKGAGFDGVQTAVEINLFGDRAGTLVTAATEAASLDPKRAVQMGADWTPPPVESFLFPEINPTSAGTAPAPYVVPPPIEGPAVPGHVLGLIQRRKQIFATGERVSFPGFGAVPDYNETAYDTYVEAKGIADVAREQLASVPVGTPEHTEYARQLEGALKTAQVYADDNPWIAEVEQLDEEIALHTRGLQDEYGMPGARFDELMDEYIQRLETPITRLVDGLGTKILNQRGRPLTVVHGTGSTFTKFAEPGMDASTGNLFGDVPYYSTSTSVVAGQQDVLAAQDVGGDFMMPRQMRAPGIGGTPYAFGRAADMAVKQKFALQAVQELEADLAEMPAMKKSMPIADWRRRKDQLENELFEAQAKLDRIGSIDVGAQMRVSYLLSQRPYVTMEPTTAEERTEIVDKAIELFPDWATGLNELKDRLAVQHYAVNPVTQVFEPAEITKDELYDILHAVPKDGYDPNNPQSWPTSFPKNYINEVLRQVGYDVLEYEGGRIMNQGIEHRAFAVLDPKIIVDKYAEEDAEMIIEVAASRGIQLTKQLAIMNSPALGDIAQHSEFTDGDVAQAFMTWRPGSTVAVKGISDPGRLVQDIVKGRLEWASLKPEHWQFVEREGRIDLLLSSKEEITPEMVADYKEFGVFKGMMVKTLTKSGAKQRMIWRAFRDTKGKAKVQVFEPGPGGIGIRRDGTLGNRSVNVNLENVLVDGFATEAPTINAENEYNAFIGQLNKEAMQRNLGGWMDLPRETMAAEFELWMAANEIKDPGRMIALQSYFDARMIEDWRASAPELNELDAAIADEIARMDEIEENVPNTILPEDYLESMAGARGFIVHPFNDGTYALIDQFSSNKLYFDSIDSTRAFLQEFIREVPDGDPGSDVPIEVMRNFGPTNQASTGPSVGQQRKRARKAAKKMTQQTALVDDSADPPVLFDVPQTPTAPPGLGGPPPSMLSELAPHAGDLEAVFTSWMHRNLLPTRTTFADLEGKFMELGFPDIRPWEQYSQVSQGMDIAHNEAHPLHGRIAQAIDHLRSTHIRSGNVWKVFSGPTKQERGYRAQRLGMTPSERARTEELFNIFKDIHASDPDWADRFTQLTRFVETVGTNQRMGTPDPYGALDQFPLIRGFAEHSRDSFADFRFPDASKILHQYLKSYTFDKHVGPSWAQMGETWRRIGSWRDPIDGSHPLAPVAKFVQDWMYTVRYGHTDESDIALDTVQSLVNSTVGKIMGPITKGEASNLINGALSAVYRSVMGWRVFPIVRDATQPVMAIPRVGPINLAESFSTLLRGTQSQKDHMIDLMARYGILQKGIPPIESGLQVQGEYIDTARRTFTPQELARRDMSSRVKGWLRDMVPPSLRTINGTKLDPMWAYTNQGGYNRIITGYAAHLNFTKGLASWLARRTAAINSGSSRIPSTDEFLRSIDADSFQPAATRKIRELVDNGEMEEAAKWYTNEVVNDTQFRYGTREVAPSWRGHGARMVLQFGNFFSQTLAHLRNAAKHGSNRYRLKVLMGMSILGGATVLAKKRTGWDFNKYMWFNVLGYAGGPSVGLLNLGQQAMEAIGDVTQGRDPYYTGEQAIGQVMSGEGWLDALSTLNPTAGAAENWNQLVEPTGVRASPNPVAAAMRYFITGDKRGAGGDFEHHFNNPDPSSFGGGAGAQ